MNEILVKCDSIKKSFTRRKAEPVDILKNVTFSVKKGEIFSITGKSGVGKTTLLGIVAGIDKVDSGSITVHDHDLVTLSENELSKFRRNNIGIIFQNHNLISSWNALENVEAAIAGNYIAVSVIRQRSLEILTLMGLQNRLYNLPGELSAGEQQRVAVARALVNRPALIIADEPVADVDPATASEILSILVNESIKNGSTIIFATHGNPPAGFDKHIMILQDGTLQPFLNGVGEKIG